MKKRLLASIAVGLLVVSCPILASANYYTGGRASGLFSAWYSSSVSQYGYTPHYDDGRNNWNGITGKAGVSKVTTNGKGIDEYYVGTTKNVGVLGNTAPYKRYMLYSYVPASTEETWSYCVLSLYDNSIKAETVGSRTGLTYSEIVSSVTTHEIGHSLSLDHSPEGKLSVMVDSGITDFSPTDYDKSELIAKWGN